METRHNTRKMKLPLKLPSQHEISRNVSKRKRILTWLIFFSVVSLLFATAKLDQVYVTLSSHYVQTPTLPEPVSRIKVFSAFSNDSNDTSRQHRHSFWSPNYEYIALSPAEQLEFLEQIKCISGEIYQKFPQNLAQELFKYCALYEYGGLYLDAESPLVESFERLISLTQNVAVLNDPIHPKTIHGSVLLLREPRSKIAEQMIYVLTTTPMELLKSSPLFLPRTLYDFIANEISLTELSAGGMGDWFLLQHKCNTEVLSHKETNSTSHAMYGYRYEI